MKLKVRLYRQHDLDLIALKKTEGYQLGREMKRCLISYAKGELYVPPDIKFEEQENLYVEKCCQMNIKLSPQHPEEFSVIMLLNSIRPGYRCSFIKALFRNCATCLPLMAYADGNGYVTTRGDSDAKVAMAILSRKPKPKAETREEPDTPKKKNRKQDPDETRDDAKTRKEEGAPVRKQAEEPATPKEPADDDFDKLFAGFDKLGR